MDRSGDRFIFTVLASLNVAMETALQHMSHSKAEELAADGKAAHQRVLDMVADPAPLINTAMLVRVISEVTATALVALLIFGHFDLPWQQVLVVVASWCLLTSWHGEWLRAPWGASMTPLSAPSGLVLGEYLPTSLAPSRPCLSSSATL
ncbi:magnesium and cobalt efflux protein CorC [Cutibacterium acnes JCM 18909]|nr:magnesium and cobalt efflux protein CorC [Cutibacterium acnes JCM 18909]